MYSSKEMNKSSINLLSNSSTLYKFLIRPILFLIDPERVHHISFKGMRFLSSLGLISLVRPSRLKDPKLQTEVFGIKFPNPVGLAAGFDKDAKLVDPLADLGFGFVEIGTLTPKPQPGNDKPRLFRLKKDSAVINRMGFNNGGVEAAVARLKKKKKNIIVGGNIGKNKVTPNENALDDYLICYHALKDIVDYFVVNVSSPNTPGLRDLQEKGPLLKILGTLQEENQKIANPKPILLKIAPDLTDGQLDDIVDIVTESGIAGIICTNTTISRDNLQTEDSKVEAIGNGGLSGKPLTKRSTEVIRYINNKSEGKIKIIGVGGIMNGADAVEKLNAGASLVQIYTGFIYEGPALIKDINKAVLASRT